jgi:peroxin-1
VAVHLLRPASSGSPTKEAYVGWTGFPSASSLAQFQSQNARREGFMETVEIDPQYAQALGFAEGITLEIGLLHDLAVAKSISTEPYSADDWEILVNLLRITVPCKSNAHMIGITRPICRK